jgi:hypothetical protein
MSEAQGVPTAQRAGRAGDAGASARGAEVPQ